MLADVGEHDAAVLGHDRLPGFGLALGFRRSLLIGGGAGVGLIVAFLLWPRHWKSDLSTSKGEQAFGKCFGGGDALRGGNRATAFAEFAPEVVSIRTHRKKHPPPWRCARNDLEPGVQVGTLGSLRAFRYEADLLAWLPLRTRSRL